MTEVRGQRILKLEFGRRKAENSAQRAEALKSEFGGRKAENSAQRAEALKSEFGGRKAEIQHKGQRP